MIFALAFSLAIMMAATGTEVIIMAKAALVTGASSGIGKIIARELKSAGFRVYAAARRLERMADLEKDGIVPIALDLTRDESIVACVKSVLSREKSIDVLGQ